MNLPIANGVFNFSETPSGDSFVDCLTVHNENSSMEASNGEGEALH
jgi:hypothetical protein